METEAEKGRGTLHSTQQTHPNEDVPPTPVPGPRKDTGHREDGANAAEEQTEWPDPGSPRLGQALHPPEDKELQPEVEYSHKEGEEGPHQVRGPLVLFLGEEGSRVEGQTCGRERATMPCGEAPGPTPRTVLESCHTRRMAD